MKGCRKDLKYVKKSLVNVNRCATFAPATAKAFIEILARIENQGKEIFLKKDSKKLVRFENAFYICTPQTKFSEHFFR